MSYTEIKNKYGEAGISDFQGTTVRYIACDIARILIRYCGHPGNDE